MLAVSTHEQNTETVPCHRNKMPSLYLKPKTLDNIYGQSLLISINSPQLAKMKKYIPYMSLPWNL